MEALVDAVNIYMFNKSKQYCPYWVRKIKIQATEFGYPFIAKLS